MTIRSLHLVIVSLVLAILVMFGIAIIVEFFFVK